MSTKNLARTLIEGGRAGYNKWRRRYSHHQERALTRAYLARAAVRDDGFDSEAVGRRPKVYKDFADKLGAPRRWLRSHVGQPWDKVRAEMFARFEPRSLAGRHIIYDHMLPEVQIYGDDRPRFGRYYLFVDAHGILRERPVRRAPASKASDMQLRTEREVAEWAAGRCVGGQGDALYWYVIARRCIACNGKGEACCCPRIERERVHGPHVHYRQDSRLTASEVAFWHTLVESIQIRYAFPQSRARRCSRG